MTLLSFTASLASAGALVLVFSASTTVQAADQAVTEKQCQDAFAQSEAAKRCDALDFGAKYYICFVSGFCKDASGKVKSRSAIVTYDSISQLKYEDGELTGGKRMPSPW